MEKFPPGGATLKVHDGLSPRLGAVARTLSPKQPRGDARCRFFFLLYSEKHLLSLSLFVVNLSVNGRAQLKVWSPL